MREIYYLSKRTILLYIRDYVAVFFSVLSMLIVLALMVVFLGNMNSENVVEALEQYGNLPDAAASEEMGNLPVYSKESGRDRAADKENASYLIQMWTLAGILIVNAVTITMTVMGTMVQDETKHRLASFYIAPVGRMKIALGYILSSWMAGIGMCVLTLVLGEAYMALCGHPLLAATDCLALFGMIVLNTFVYASVAYLLALFIHTESAWSSILTIVGTLVGFVGAIYLPMSMLPEGVGKVLKCLPVLHGAAMMREVCTRDAIERTFAGLPDSAGDVFREQMGVSVFIGGKEISLHSQILFLAVCAIIAMAASAWISKGRKLRDR